MNYLLEGLHMDLEVLMEKKNVKPIEVRLQLQNDYPVLDKSEIIKAIHDYNETIRKFNYCEKVGHDFVVEGYNSTETGWESWNCKRCGYGGSPIYY